MATIEHKFYEAGYHTIDWNASEFASGKYFINLTIDDITLTKPITLLK